MKKNTRNTAAPAVVKMVFVRVEGRFAYSGALKYSIA